MDNNRKRGTEILSKEKRSAVMRSVPTKNTKPEMMVRSTLHAMGYRFRVHRRDLPGTPDIVLPKWKTAMFVHGCFWHRHEGCRRTTTPTNNYTFWQSKFYRNQDRDADIRRKLEAMGWRVVVVWECETKSSRKTLEERLRELLMLQSSNREQEIFIQGVLDK